MINAAKDVLLESFQITLFVLIMMITVDLVNVWARGKLASILHTESKWKQYIVTSFIGSIPGDVGAFAVVSLYIYGMIGFSTLSGAMLAGSGDGAFVMLAMFPKTAIFLFITLFIVGIFAGRVTDYLVGKFKIKVSQGCGVKQYHKEHENYRHYLKEHVWNHIIRKHLWKIFLWTFGALFLLNIGLSHWHIQKLASEYTLLLLFVGALIGLIPESSPNLIIITMFAGGLIPFSVLFTNSIVQNGHGLLPLLSYSVKDSILIKLFNFSFGITLGLILYSIGI